MLSVAPSYIFLQSLLFLRPCFVVAVVVLFKLLEAKLLFTERNTEQRKKYFYISPIMIQEYDSKYYR